MQSGGWAPWTAGSSDEHERMRVNSNITDWHTMNMNPNHQRLILTDSQPAPSTPGPPAPPPIELLGVLLGVSFPEMPVSGVGDAATPSVASDNLFFSHRTLRCCCEPTCLRVCQNTRITLSLRCFPVQIFFFSASVFARTHSHLFFFFQSSSGQASLIAGEGEDCLQYCVESGLTSRDEIPPPRFHPLIATPCTLLYIITLRVWLLLGE